MKQVILMCGKMQVGKNKLTEFLQTEFIKKGYTVSIDAFAKGVKDNCKEDFKQLTYQLNNIAEEIRTNVYNFTNDRDAIFKQSIIAAFEYAVNKLKIMDENWYENKTPLTRIILQVYGTEIFRKRVDDCWWAKQAQQRILNSNSDIIIFTDTRFPNEITTINDILYENQYQTTSIRIQRNNNDNEFSKHDSETALDNWMEYNYIVDNNSDLNELKNSAVTICNDILNNNTDINYKYLHEIIKES
jgi:hypothetical protein